MEKTIFDTKSPEYKESLAVFRRDIEAKKKHLKRSMMGWLFILMFACVLLVVGLVNYYYESGKVLQTEKNKALLESITVGADDTTFYFKPNK